MATLRKKLGTALIGVAALSMTLTACSGGGAGGDEAIDTSSFSGEIDYWLWENAQLPAYQACADAFQQENPGTTIKISQFPGTTTGTS